MVREYWVHLRRVSRLQPRRWVWTIAVRGEPPERSEETAGIFHVYASSRDEATANVMASIWQDTGEVVEIETEGLSPEL